MQAGILYQPKKLMIIVCKIVKYTSVKMRGELCSLENRSTALAAL